MAEFDEDDRELSAPIEKLEAAGDHESVVEASRRWSKMAMSSAGT